MSEAVQNLDFPVIPVNAEDLTGKVFHNLTVESFHGKNRFGNLLWNCSCKCGGAAIVRSYPLKTGRTKSCGCWSASDTKRRMTKHGMYKTKIYRIWSGMIARCSQPYMQNWSRYGGRGITVCDRWVNGDGEISGFECFARDLGPMPSERHSVERNDVNGNYCPENCCWILKPLQQRNMRNTRWVVWEGKRMSLAEFVEVSGFKESRIRELVYRKKLSTEEMVKILTKQKTHE